MTSGVEQQVLQQVKLNADQHRELALMRQQLEEIQKEHFSQTVSMVHNNPTKQKVLGDNTPERVPPQLDALIKELGEKLKAFPPDKTVSNSSTASSSKTVPKTTEKELLPTIAQSKNKSLETMTETVETAQVSTQELQNNTVETLYYTPLTENAFKPNYMLPNSAAFDLASAYEYNLPPHSRISVKTDLCLKPPSGCYIRIAGRSSLARNSFIDVAAGVIDPSYTGNVQVLLLNHSNDAFTVQKG